jgi:hypothetical protein
MTTKKKTTQPQRLDEGIRKEIEDRARSLARIIGVGMPENMGLTVMIHDKGVGWIAYFSTVEREEVIRTLREAISKLEMEGITIQ